MKQQDQTTASISLLDQKTSNGACQPIENEHQVFDHRCALEHSQHFKEEATKAKRAVNKLILVATVSAIFCASEGVGGVLSGSLAILCDAAHQLSDVAGFVISFLAICLTKKPATTKYSFGYHRADVIGALGSILIIWGLLIWLLLEAVHRVMNPSDINGEIMLITACFGLGCNILNIVILNFCCNQKDEVGQNMHLFESVASAYKPYSGTKIAAAIKSTKSKSHRGGSIASRSNASVMSHYDAEADAVVEPGTPHLKDSSHKKLNYSKEGSSTLLSTSKKQHEDLEKSAAKKIDEIKEEAQEPLRSKNDGIPEVQSMAAPVEQENLNVRAAIVHMVGDMVQSIGVIIAAVIIYIKPDWTIADPICTFLFSILVMITTIPIFSDCMRFLMESAPEDIDSVEVYNAILALEFVKEIHDFHLWALSDAKPIFTAHVVIEGNPSYALYCITELMQKEFDVYHSTIQVEPTKKKSTGPGLLRCVNEHNFHQNVNSPE